VPLTPYCTTTATSGPSAVNFYVDILAGLMAGLIKDQAGSLVAALALCALPLPERQSHRIPALVALRLVGSGDGLSVTATSFDATIATSLAKAEADGEVAVGRDGLRAF